MQQRRLSPRSIDPGNANSLPVIRKVAYFLLIALFSVSCYWDSEEYLYPELGSACDTASVTYSAKVVPLLQSYCLSCHSAGSAANLGGNIRLDTYPQVQVYAANGQLLGSVKHEAGYAQMPKGSTRLSECQIAIIEKWITDGTVNN